VTKTQFCSKCGAGHRLERLLEKTLERRRNHKKRREIIDKNIKNVNHNEIYPWDLGAGSLFRNLEHLSLYHLATLATELSAVPMMFASNSEMPSNCYMEWCRASNLNKIFVIRSIIVLHIKRQDGMTATDVSYAVQSEGISPSQVKRVIKYGFELGCLEEVDNEKRERYFKVTDAAYAHAQELFRVRICTPRIKESIMHLAKVYQMLSLPNDKAAAERELGLIEHEPVPLEEMLLAYMEEKKESQNDLGLDQFGPKLVSIENVPDKAAVVG